MKIDRQLGILSILLQKESVTAPYLSEMFEVSRRTINRDIEDLCKAGIPTEKENLEITNKEYKSELDKLLTNTGSKNEKELNKTFKSYYGFDAKTIVKKDLLREKVLSYLVKNVVEQ